MKIWFHPKGFIRLQNSENLKGGWVIKPTWYTTNCLCFIVCVCTFYSFLLSFVSSSSKAFLCSFFFVHPPHINAFYLPKKIFHHWRMIVKWKTSKNLELSRLPNTQKKFIFNGRDFPYFNQIFFLFFLHPRIWPKAIYNSTKLDFPNLNVIHQW